MRTTKVHWGWPKLWLLVYDDHAWGGSWVVGHASNNRDWFVHAYYRTRVAVHPRIRNPSRRVAVSSIEAPCQVSNSLTSPNERSRGIRDKPDTSVSNAAAKPTARDDARVGPPAFADAAVLLTSTTKENALNKEPRQDGFVETAARLGTVQQTQSFRKRCFGAAANVSVYNSGRCLGTGM